MINVGVTVSADLVVESDGTVRNVYLVPEGGDGSLSATLFFPDNDEDCALACDTLIVAVQRIKDALPRHIR